MNDTVKHIVRNGLRGIGEAMKNLQESRDKGLSQVRGLSLDVAAENTFISLNSLTALVDKAKGRRLKAITEAARAAWVSGKNLDTVLLEISDLAQIFNP